MQTKNRFLLFLLIISISACKFSNAQELTPSFLSPSTTPSPFVTFTPSPISVNTLSPTPESSERLCSSDDFQTTSIPPDFRKPETLIGFRPDRDWSPPSDWEKTIGIYNPEFDYSIGGYKNLNQHIFILRKPLCRDGENAHILSEIKDVLLIPNLEENVTIIWSPTIEQCCFFQPNITERFEFKWERFAIIDCTQTHPRAIMLAKYNLNELPNKIEPGTHLPVEVIKGWLPTTDAEKFEEFSTTGILCTISFQGA